MVGIIRENVILPSVFFLFVMRQTAAPMSDMDCISHEPGAQRRPLLSVIIKTLNEEAKIGACLASVLAATQDYRTQVIVADSRSDDRTVAIARGFGVDVVRLAPSEPRGCGIGAQLGFQHASGEYVLLMDGDMRLAPGFLPEALARLEEDDGLAGVGGLMELDEANLEYRLRLERNMPHLRPGVVDRLDGGGLFRRRAIESVGYLTNRNLHSYEELDLALRLRAAGWRLRRIATVAVSHHGHAVPALRLLSNRWRNRYTDGQGEAVRAALGTRRVVPLLREFWLSAAVVGWWCCLVLSMSSALGLGAPLWPSLVLAVFPFIVMTIKRRSLVKAGYSIILWQVIAAGFIRGLLRRQRDPREPIESEVIDGAPVGASTVKRPPNGSLREAGSRLASMPENHHAPQGQTAYAVVVNDKR
jgi:glycosyltransferase involved in cell wall biosynthesis